MNVVLDAASHIRFSSPFLFLICAPLLAVVVLHLLHFRTIVGEKKILLSGLEEWRRENIGPSFIRWIRTVLLLLLCVMTGIAWSAPELLLPSPNGALEQERAQQFLVLLDLSGSMGEFESTSVPGADKQKFEVVREGFRKFVQGQKNARIGLILFSDNAFVAAYPTHDHLFLERAILQDDLSYGQSHTGGFQKHAQSQVAQFSLGTSVANALDASLEVLEEEAAPPDGRAVILVTDLEDSAKEIVAAIDRLSKANARVYVVGVKMDEAVAGAITSTFGTQHGVRLYPTQSEQELEYAFQDIGTREHAVAFSSKAQSSYVPFDLFPVCIGAILALLVGLAATSETFFIFLFAHSSRRKKNTLLQLLVSYFASRRKS